MRVGEERETLFRIERGANTGQREPQLDESHGHRGLDANHHRLGAKQPRCRGNTADESGQEGVNGSDSGEIEQHTTCCPVLEELTEVLLQLQGVVVVELFLHGGDKDLTEGDDRDPGH